MLEIIFLPIGMIWKIIQISLNTSQCTWRYATMYLFNPEELRAIHEERVGHLKTLYGDSAKNAKTSHKPRFWERKWFKRSEK